MMAHAFNFSTREAEVRDLCEFKANLVCCRASSRTARATQRNLFLKKKRKKEKKKKE